MKKNIKKLQLKKTTVIALNHSEKQLLNGGLTTTPSMAPVCAPTVRLCPTTPGTSI